MVCATLSIGTEIIIVSKYTIAANKRVQTETSHHRLCNSENATQSACLSQSDGQSQSGWGGILAVVLQPDLLVAHRRLTIIDLTDAGAQPMAPADGQLRITFNGEIYSYCVDALIKKGWIKACIIPRCPARG